jgi:CBS domain-containing membrane protein
MKATRKPLNELTAADLMSPDVVAIPRHLSLRGAAERLEQARVSGAPVVDEEGHCLGVVSSADLVRWLSQGGADARLVSDIELRPEDELGACTTTDLVIAWPETRIGELARRMIDAGVHRVVVLDSAGHLVGIVSATDIVAAVAARASPEQPPPC